MKSTFDLLEAYLFTIKIGYTELRLDTYNLNGSVIKIYYSYQYDWCNDRTNYNESSIEVDLLDYISFVFNSSL